MLDAVVVDHLLKLLLLLLLLELLLLHLLLHLVLVVLVPLLLLPGGGACWQRAEAQVRWQHETWGRRVRRRARAQLHPCLFLLKMYLLLLAHEVLLLLLLLQLLLLVLVLLLLLLLLLRCDALQLLLLLLLLLLRCEAWQMLLLQEEQLLMLLLEEFSRELTVGSGQAGLLLQLLLLLRLLLQLQLLLLLLLLLLRAAPRRQHGDLGGDQRVWRSPGMPRSPFRVPEAVMQLQACASERHGSSG